MKSKSFKLLVKVSKNRRWLGTVGENSYLPSRVKRKTQVRGRGSVFFSFGFLSKKGEVFF